MTNIRRSSDSEVAIDGPGDEEKFDGDEDDFVAFCADASSVLNNDPNHRYHVNKLYQPMNGQSRHQQQYQDDSTQLIEQDDEYLLYQELRFLESAAQELSGCIGEKSQVRLTKILEDDEGEDEGRDEDQLVNHDVRHDREDALDSLQFTTIIDSFDNSSSFPSSPLIDNCNGRDLLSSETCVSEAQVKPDSSSSTQRPDDYESSRDDDNETISLSGSSNNGSLKKGKKKQNNINKSKRRTANERERNRMFAINQAFEKLKKVVPIEMIKQAALEEESEQANGGTRRTKSSAGSNNLNESNNSDSTSEQQPVKLTKITTLRLAVSYIAKLSEVLNEHSQNERTSNGSSTSLNTTRNTLITSAVTPPGGPSISVAQPKAAVRERKRRAKRESSASPTNRKRPKQDSIPAIDQKSNGKAPLTASNTTSQLEPVEDELVVSTNSSKQNVRIGYVESPPTNSPTTTTRIDQPATIILNQTNLNHQRQPIIIATHNVMTGGSLHPQTSGSIQANTFAVPITATANATTNHQVQHQPKISTSTPSVTYSPYQRQPQTLTISQAPQINNVDRAFVTPVAVAILGIQTSNGPQPHGEPQSLQLLGLQSAQPVQQRNSLSYNLIAPQPQPQPVTLTLDDVNGLSVLRLTNQQNGSTIRQAVQIQQSPAPAIALQQPTNILTPCLQANIRQLVASLATSILPNNNSTNQRVDTRKSESEIKMSESTPQQPKKTYRFHNYDGNMINNHVYI